MYVCMYVHIYVYMCGYMCIYVHISHQHVTRSRIIFTIHLNCIVLMHLTFLNFKVAKFSYQLLFYF